MVQETAKVVKAAKLKKNKVLSFWPISPLWLLSLC